jgi:hypothetical protein
MVAIAVPTGPATEPDDTSEFAYQPFKKNAATNLQNGSSVVVPPQQGKSLSLPAPV